MSPFDQARSIFRAIRDDADAIKVQRDAYKTLAASITSADGAMRITSSTVNGQSFGAAYTSNPQERLSVLSILMGMLERDSAGSKTTIGRFR